MVGRTSALAPYYVLPSLVFAARSFAVRRFVSLLVMTMAVPMVPAFGDEAVMLQEPVQVGSEVQTTLHLVLRGEIQVDKRDEKITGQALLSYPEKVLTVDASGLATNVARFYDDARAKFVIGKTEDARQLRAGIRLIVGSTTEKGLELWSPSGPLNADEQELIEDVLDTTQLPGLLPTKAVKVGDKWDCPDLVEKRLCDLDEVVTSTIECTVKELDAAKAVITVAGKIHGLSFGSEVKSAVDSTLTFDREKKMITLVEWKQIDSRSPSPVSPAGAYEVGIKIERAPVSSPAVSDKVLANVNTKMDDASTLLVFEDPKQRYRFLHDRQWHVTLLEDDRAILRRLQGRDMIAQLNIHMIGENKNIAALEAEQLQAFIIQAGDMKIDEIIRSEALATDGPNKIRLVKAKGKTGEMELVQRHYIVQDNAGHQVLFSYLTEPPKEEKLGSSDISLVNSIEFTQSKAASKPTPTPK